MEQGLGVCVLAVRFGAEVGLAGDELRRIHQIALLRHVGCTAETVEFASIMGAELEARRRGGALIDWARPAEALGYIVSTMVRDTPPLLAARRLAALSAAIPRLKAGRSLSARSRSCWRRASGWRPARAPSW